MASIRVLDWLERTMARYKELLHKLEMRSTSVITIKSLDGNTDGRVLLLDQILEYDNLLECIDNREEKLIRFLYVDGLTFRQASERIGVSRATAFRLRDEAALKLYKKWNKECCLTAAAAQ